MMFSVISVMTAISIFFGGFAMAPISASEINSGAFTFKVETKLNKPISEELAEALDRIPLDNLSGHLDMKFNRNEAFKQQEMQYDAVLSNNIDDPIQMSYWLKSDFSDKNVPKTLSIYRMWEDESYYVSDIQHPMVYGGANVPGMISRLMSNEVMQSVNNLVSEILQERDFKLTEKNGEVTAVMDEKTLKEVIRQIALGISEPLYMVFGTSQPYMNDSINDFFDKLDKIQIFGEEALNLHMTKGENGQPKNIRYDINILANVYELINAFEGYIDEDLTKENSDIDMTVTFDFSYQRINEDITIDYPALNDENSVDISGEQSLPGIDVNAVNIVVDNQLAQMNHKPFEKDGVIYLPLREVLNLKGVGDEDILWDNGAIQLKTPHYSAKLAIGSKEIIRDGQSLVLDEEVLLQEDTTFIPFSAFGDLGLGGMTNTFFDDDDALIGCVLSIYKYREDYVNTLRFLVSGISPQWEKLLYMAGDMAGANIDVIFTVEEQYLEQTNLVIAAGDPMVIVGKYSDEFIERLVEMDVIYPPLKVDEEYSVLVQKVMKNPDAAIEVAKQFVDLIHKYDEE